jgi:hypothetical protein
MKRIKVTCNWLAEKNLMNLISKINNQFVFKDNFDPDLEFCLEEPYDYLVFFNGTTINLMPDIEKEKILGFIQEPPFYNECYSLELGKYCKKVFTCADKKYYINNQSFVSAPSVMFYNLGGKGEVYRYNKNFNKRKKLSICVSDLKGKHLYEFRRELVFKIIESDLQCDIFGSGWNFNDPRYKGSPKNKSDALIPYEFSIGIENSLYDGYITEKLFDCFLCNTVPIYYGTDTVDLYYDKNSFIKLPFVNDISMLISWLKDFVASSEYLINNYKEGVLRSKERYFTSYNIYNKIKDFVLKTDGKTDFFT